MDPIQFALEPRDRKRSPEWCAETAASDGDIPPGPLSWLILAAVLLLIPIIVGSFTAHHSTANVAGLEANGDPSSEADELDGLIPRGWQ
jgi:hypothetical protein